MRIATLQFAPKLGDVEGNIRRANDLLQNGQGATPASGLDTLKPDILVLPELALTGYNFPSREAIAPYLEPAGQGPSAAWARQTAKKYGCKVCVGYPEIEAASAGRDQASSPGTCYNSLLVVDERGEVILNYRKTFLYYTDETWAAEGDAARGFHELTFGPSPSGGGGGGKAVATSFGICMDINPYRFEAPFTAWEFAHRVLDSKTELVVLSMAWLTLLNREEMARLADRPDMDTFNYWIQRFLPLVRKRMQHGVAVDGPGGKQIIIVFANRAGEEEGADGASPARYAGTSTILAIRQRPVPHSQSGSRAAGAVSDGEGGEEGSASEAADASAFDVKILCWDMMGAGSEGICFADTTADPRMVFGLVKAGT